MALSNNFKQGFHNLPSYEISGIPFVKTVSLAPGNSAYISFPYVTNFLHFTTNSSSNDRRIKIGFTPNSIANGKFIETQRMIRNSDNIVDPAFSYRCNEIYLKNDSAVGTVQISVVAGLTNIPSGSFPVNYENIVYGI